MKQVKNIKLLILDIDGTMTNGIIYYGSNQQEMRGFHVHDGMGLKLLRKSGVEVAVISAKQSELVSKRLADLKIEHVYLGYEEKIPAFEQIKQKLGLDDNQIAYMGDDLTDLAPMRKCGFAICPPNAPAVVQQHCAYITQKKPGKGAVREACELIMHEQNTYDSVLKSYL